MVEVQKFMGWDKEEGKTQKLCKRKQFLSTNNSSISGVGNAWPEQPDSGTNSSCNVSQVKITLKIIFKATKHRAAAKELRVHLPWVAVTCPGCSRSLSQGLRDTR